METVEELKAKLAAQAAQLAAVNAARRADLVAKYRDRIAPSALASFEAYGETCGDDLGKFETFLKNLPVVTRATRESTSPEVVQAAKTAIDGIASVVNASGVGGIEGAKQVSRLLGGLSIAKIDKAQVVRGARADGTFELTDGTVISKEELQKLLAA